MNACVGSASFKRPPDHAGIRQAGFTLIELLVAMVIGVLVIMGATQLFIASQQNYRLTTALAEMQDTGRFALETLSRELREVGFQGGCSTDDIRQEDTITTEHALKGSSQPDSSLSDAIPNMHTLEFRGGPTPGVPNPVVFSTGRLASNSGDGSSQLRLLQSPLRCSLYQNDAALQTLDAFYYPDGKTFEWVLDSAIYYLGTDVTNANAPSLRRLDTSGNRGDEVLASHVAALRTRFLVGQQYLPPESLEADQWQSVRAVRITLIVQSERTDLRQTPTVIATGNFDSAPFRANDGRLYQAFTTTINLRNRP